MSCQGLSIRLFTYVLFKGQWTEVRVTVALAIQHTRQPRSQLMASTDTISQGESTAPSTIPVYKTNLLSACVSASVLSFGTYTLKSGRQSPYFFNAGLLHTGVLLESLENAYAHTILDYIKATPSSSFKDFDVIFGPAYKGIPLAVETLSALTRLNRENFGGRGYSFNRKENKDHGEGGGIVGARLRDRKVIIVDDVVTAGTALNEAAGIIKAEGGELVGVVIALDRMERMPSKEEVGHTDNVDGATDDAPRKSTVDELRQTLGVPVLPVLTLDDLIGFSKEERNPKDLKRLEEYRAKYVPQD